MKCDKCGYEVHGYSGQPCPGCEDGKLQEKWYKPSSLLNWLSKQSEKGEELISRIKIHIEPKDQNNDRS